MTRIVLVHGSVVDGRTAWEAQLPLSERHEVVVLDRPGAIVADPVERTTYAEQAAWLGSKLKAGDHLVGHSSGGIVALLAAAEATASIGTLCVLEPPAFAHAGDDAAAHDMSVRMQELWTAGPSSPRSFLLGFFDAFLGGAPPLPDPLPPELEHGARQLQLEQGPWEVQVPLEMLAARRIPTLIMTGGWSLAMDAIAEALAGKLGTRTRTEVMPGAGHDIQQAPRFNDRLDRFITAWEKTQR